jgi:phospholipid/cholesterol/gamma-HCH transport system ATP-binding protein
MNMTVEENIVFPRCACSRRCAESITERSDELLERMDLTHISKRIPAKYRVDSKRVALARLNNRNTSFSDEPNSGLDPQTAAVIDNLIHEITVGTRYDYGHYLARYELSYGNR